MVALKESRQALNKKPKKKPDHEQVEEETPKPENTDEDSDLADKVKGLKLKKKTNQKKKKKKTLDQQSEEEEEHTEPETNQESSKASKLKKKKKATTKMSKKKALEEPEEEEEEEEGIPEAELSFYSNADEEQDRENGSESDGPGGAAEESDSSEDEVAPRNTIGDVPLKWYEDEDHIGYNISGKKIKKQAKRDMLESFLADADNNKNWRKIHDDYNDEEIELTKEEIKLIRRVLKGKTPNAKTDPYQDYVDFFKWDDAKHPLSNAPEPKRRFIPSKSENKMVIKLVRAIRNGNIKINQPIEEPHLKLLWGDDSSSFENAGRGWSYIPAPKPKLAGHEESYNPSVEFIPTPEERNSYELMYEEDRPRFIPTSFGSLRSVPAYKNALKETMDRCLDLYLCPRTLKKRINIDPESLKPKLPSRKDLKPYPSTCYLEYKGHKGAILSISIDMSGKWLASGSTDGTVRVWEVQNGRCLKIWEVSEAVHHVSWNPVLPILAVSVGHDVLLLDTGYGNEEQQEKIKELVHVEAPSDSENSASIVNWLQHDKYDGIRLKHIKNVSTVEWHRRGDYFSTVMPGGDSRAILIHQLSKRSTKNISFKLHGLPVSSKFHPTRSFFFISTKKTIRVYDLVKEKLIRKLEPGVREVSSISIHPAGDNVIVGSREGKLCWFDMDLSSKPYQRLKCHPKDITNVAFHRSYPLFASCSEDGTAYVFHGMVYADINQNPLIVPLEILRGHTSTNGRGVLDCVFHPRNPWLFTAGADSVIKLYVD